MRTVDVGQAGTDALLFETEDTSPNAQWPKCVSTNSSCNGACLTSTTLHVHSGIVAVQVNDIPCNHPQQADTLWAFAVICDGTTPPTLAPGSEP